MPDLPTRVDYFDIGADEFASRSAARPLGQRLSSEEVFTEGSDTNIQTASASAMAEEVTRQLAIKVAALFLASAEEEDLDRLVADRFSPTIVRKEAAPAVVTLELSRVTGSFPAGSIAAGTRIRTGDGTEFKTRLAVAFAALQLGPISVDAEATLAGTVGNVGVGTVVQFVEQPFDSNILATNPEPAAGGDDRQTDERLREQARDFFIQARRGTVSAITFGALQVAGVRQATTIELVDELGRPNGFVQQFIADAQGQANTALASAVRGNLLEFRAAGVVVDVISGTPVFVPIVYRLRFDAGTDSTEAFASIQQGTLAAVNTLLPDEILPESLLFEVARSVPGVIVLEDAIVEPVGDLVPSTGEVIRTRLDLITAE